MKKINKFLGLGLGVVAAFSLASCSNDVNEPNNTPDNEDVVLNLVKTPDVIAWTGSKVLGASTKGYYPVVEGGKTKYYYMHDEEVEVNLALLDQHDKVDIADLAAKLSIHVRNANDVKVTIPIPAYYFVDSDDIVIFKKHYENTDAYKNQVYSYLDEQKATTHESTYSIAGQTVRLKITLGEANVTVETSGINKDVMAELFGENSEHDGLNFEVYLYLQPIDYMEALSKDKDEEKTKFFNALNEGSTVEFIDVDGEALEPTDEEDDGDDADEPAQVLPKYYINAFGFQYIDGAKIETPHPFHCAVVPVDNENYATSTNDLTHLNGTPYNTIYVLTGVEADHAHNGEGGEVVEDDTVTETDQTEPTPGED